MTRHNDDSRFGSDDPPRGTHAAIVSSLVLALVVGFAGLAEAAMSQNEIVQKVEKEFGVEVLRVEPMTADGGNAFAVTFMSPGGDRNIAYQVNTVVVDADTGNLIIQYGAGPSMPKNAAPPVSERTHPLTADEN